ncbi:hypothetical protein JTE90_016210 [Oedothorax gibbosus]|uniref:Ig-like domain-containing protein n=1 Tax=Oedothorax gibbosus TaxID=931172 RepID=A0AAV6UMB5_9ARAC|nr:hypothetical protein JTE90_016210 [Oedothorax gibbosus]
MRYFNKRKSGNLFRRRRAGGQFTKWTPWQCSVTCGPGVMTRTRICIIGTCEGPKIETMDCPIVPCPVGAPPQLVEQATKSLRDRSRSYQVKKGEELQLDCMGSLWKYIERVYPRYKVAWYHNEELFHHDKGRTGIIDANNDLFIVKAMPKDNGVWACQVRLDEKSQMFTSVYTIAVENSTPDIQVKEGESFEMQCNNGGLARFFESRVISQWYHNTGVVESSHSDPGTDHELGVRSAVTDSGIWKCRVSQLDVADPKRWVTNVVKVEVVPLRTSLFGSSSEEESQDPSNGDSYSGKKKGYTYGTSNVYLLLVIGVVLVVVCCGCCCCLRKRKKSKQRDTERGEGRKRSKRSKGRKKKRKLKTPKNMFIGDDENDEEEEELFMSKSKDRKKKRKPKFPPNIFLSDDEEEEHFPNKKKSPKRNRSKSSDERKSKMKKSKGRSLPKKR